MVQFAESSAVRNAFSATGCEQEEQVVDQSASCARLNSFLQLQGSTDGCEPEHERILK
jgi:hypothetical protein